MELITVQSEKDIKTLLLKEMELAKTERLLIILSKSRFDEFQTRNDVKKIFFNNGDRLFLSDDINYSIYENKHILSCNYYGIITFCIIAGLYIVKDFIFTNIPYFSYELEASKIHFIV